MSNLLPPPYIFFRKLKRRGQVIYLMIYLRFEGSITGTGDLLETGDGACECCNVVEIIV
jgi:hypothetical protein